MVFVHSAFGCIYVYIERERDREGGRESTNFDSVRILMFLLVDEKIFSSIHQLSNSVSEYQA